MNLADDDRALALGIVSFAAIFIIAGVLYLLMAGPMETVFSITETQSHSPGAVNQINTAESIWNNIMFYILLLAAVFLIARAVREGAVN